MAKYMALDVTERDRFPNVGKYVFLEDALVAESTCCNQIRVESSMGTEVFESSNLISLKSRDGHLIENWYVACLSRELSGKNAALSGDMNQSKPLRSVLYDEPLVIFRDEKGLPVVLSDICLHRAAQLSGGRATRGQIQCPYHGWTYDSEGRVVHVPSEGPEQKCARQKLKTRSYVAVEQDDCIWVWMGQGEPRTARPPFRFPHWRQRGWSHYFMITEFDNEVTHLAENFVDVPHTVFVHKGWFRDERSIKVPIKCEVSNGEVLVTYQQQNDSIGFTSRILNPRNEAMTHTDRFVMPNITRVDYNFGSTNAFIIISQISPVSTLKSRVYTAIIWRVPPVTPLLKPFLQFYTRRVIEQDVEIVANQSRNLRRDLNPQFRATAADVVHANVEKLRLFGSQNDPKVSTFKSSLETDIWI